MGIRETLNKNPAITTAGTAGIIVVALAFIIYQLSGSNRPQIQTEAYYTTDDGKTWFADDINKVPPFDHKGSPAVRVYLFTCDGGKTEFVSYLQKYTDEAKKRLEEIQKAGPEQNPGMQEEIYMTGVLVKKPGQTGWMRQMDPAAQETVIINCPDGKMENLEPVLP